jgi:hypothetical protein
MLRRLWGWLTDLKTIHSDPPPDQARQNLYDRSFDYKESQRTLIYTLLIAAVAVLLTSHKAYLLRSAAVLGILCIVHALGNIWAQHLIDERSGKPKPAVQLNLDRVLDKLFLVMVALGVIMFTIVAIEGSVL